MKELLTNIPVISSTIKPKFGDLKKIKMDIVKLTLIGYGCHIARNVINPDDYIKLEKSNKLDDVWDKNIYNRIKSGLNSFNEDLNCFGLIKGDIIIECNDKIILDLPINVLEDSTDILVIEQFYSNDSDNTAIISIQEQEGVICDTILIIDGEFEFSKLKIIKKEITYNIDKSLVLPVYCEIYYGDEIIDFLGSDTELRMSRILFNNSDLVKVKK